MSMPAANATVLGRTFGLHVLDALRERRELSFSDLAHELGMNRATLSRTLGDLVAHGFVSRKAFGRHKYYTITDQGQGKLEELRNPDLTEDRIVQLVFKSLQEKGILDRYPDISREAVVQATRSLTLAMVEKIEEELDSELGRMGADGRPQT